MQIEIPIEDYNDFLKTVDIIDKAETDSFVALTALIGRDIKTDYVGADLRDVNFSGEDLRDCDFSNCDLRGANFTNANLTGTVLNGADLRGAIFT